LRRFRIFYLVGIMLLFLASTMLLSAFWSVAEQGPDRLAFLKAILLTSAVGLCFSGIFPLLKVKN
jgi:hypothetical protein